MAAAAHCFQLVTPRRVCLLISGYFALRHDRLRSAPVPFAAALFAAFALGLAECAALTS